MSFVSIPLTSQILSIPAVLACGQSFRWSLLPTHEYRLCLSDRVVCLRQTQTALLYRTLYPDPQPTQSQLPLRDVETLAWLRDYFQLDVDLVKLYDQWASRDPVFAKVRHRFAGIRILRQDPWENLVSFICSSNNNISRITKMVQNLCTHFSPPLLSIPDPDNPDQLSTYHPFPPPSVLSQPQVATTLRTLGFGYRAEFIQKTAKLLVDSHGSDRIPGDPTEAPERWLKTLRNVSTTEARGELLKLIGVGRKVADCILLMSLDKKEVIPVDTHVYQIAVKYYGLKGSASGKVTMNPKLYDAVNSKLFSVWGEYAGWAHSVMFTADLKSFADYNLTPSASPQNSSTAKRKRGTESKDVGCLPPPLTPGSPTIDSQETTPASLTSYPNEETEVEGSSLADRVKRRRKRT